jgi:hypothetical protein
MIQGSIGTVSVARRRVEAVRTRRVDVVIRGCKSQITKPMRKGTSEASGPRSGQRAVHNQPLPRRRAAAAITQRIKWPESVSNAKESEEPHRNSRRIGHCTPLCTRSYPLRCTCRGLCAANKAASTRERAGEVSTSFRLCYKFGQESKIDAPLHVDEALQYLHVGYA